MTEDIQNGDRPALSGDLEVDHVYGEFAGRSFEEGGDFVKCGEVMHTIRRVYPAREWMDQAQVIIAAEEDRELAEIVMGAVECLNEQITEAEASGAECWVATGSVFTVENV